MAIGINKIREMENYSNLSQEEKRAKIIEDHAKGESLEMIAARSGYHEKSVSRIIRKFRNGKSTKRVKGSGRPQILTSGDKISISNCIRAKPWLSSAQIKQRLDLQAEPRTIKRFLESHNYSYRKPYKKPKLTSQAKLDRVEWALKHKNYNFSKVVFADKCSIWMHEWRGRMWLKKGSQHYIGTKAYDPKVHVWGSIGADGVIGIHVFTGNLTAPKFIAILKRKFNA